MKNICISILALAALSTAALANGNRNWDLRDSDTYVGKYATQLKNQAASSATIATAVSPLAIEKEARGLTNFERMKMISEENDQGGH